MRVRIIGTPTGEVDGIRLERMTKGEVYQVGTSLGCYLLATGLAEPVTEHAVGSPSAVDGSSSSSTATERDTANERPRAKLLHMLPKRRP